MISYLLSRRLPIGICADRLDDVGCADSGGCGRPLLVGIGDGPDIGAGLTEIALPVTLQTVSVAW